MVQKRAGPLFGATRRTESIHVNRAMMASLTARSRPCTCTTQRERARRTPRLATSAASAPLLARAAASSAAPCIADSSGCTLF